MGELRLAAAAAVLLLAAGPAAAADALPDAVAEQALFTHGKQVSTAKIWTSGGRVRAETAVGSQTMTTLLDRRAGKMWVLMPSPVGCVEQALPPDAEDPLTVAGAASEELVGTETVDGHPTKKYRIATKGTPSREHYQWRATDLGGFPIRTAAADGSYEQRFTRVELVTPDPKLFTPPVNCRPMPAAPPAKRAK